MEKNNGANYTHKELCLLLEAICENELGVYVGKNLKDIRSKVDVFANDDCIGIRRVRNKQGTTRVSAFITTYRTPEGIWNNAYSITL